jgi:hypothetical protein
VIHIASCRQLKKMKKNRIKQIWNRFKYVIITYIFVVVITIFSISSQKILSSYFENSFLTSFNASLLEDLIFFGFLGIVGIYVTTKPFREESFDVRVASLANNVDDDDAIDFLRKEVQKLLAYTEVSNIRLHIKEIDKENNLIYLFTSIENKILNMCEDVNFIFFDTNFYVEPNKSMNDDYGYISYMGIQDNQDNKNKKVFFENDIYRFDNRKSIKRSIQDFKITKGASALWKLCFGTYGEIENGKEIDWYTINMDKFTRKANLNIVNETDYKLKVEVQFQYVEKDKLQKEVIQLAENETENSIFKEKLFYKNELIKLKFKYDE